MPAPSWLKPSNRATRAPPTNEPNIGMRLATPVMRPNGRASPGEMPKIKQMMNEAITVAQPLMSETVIALVTYCEKTFVRR